MLNKDDTIPEKHSRNPNTLLLHNYFYNDIQQHSDLYPANILDTLAKSW